MLGTDEIANRISNVLVAKLGISEDRIAEVSSIERDLGATSLDVVETIMSLEDEFGIEIPTGMPKRCKPWVTSSRL